MASGKHSHTINIDGARPSIERSGSKSSPIETVQPHHMTLDHADEGYTSSDESAREISGFQFQSSLYTSDHLTESPIITSERTVSKRQQLVYATPEEEEKAGIRAHHRAKRNPLPQSSTTIRNGIRSKSELPYDSLEVDAEIMVLNGEIDSYCVEIYKALSLSPQDAPKSQMCSHLVRQSAEPTLSMRGGSNGEIRQKLKDWLARARQKLTLKKSGGAGYSRIQVGQKTRDGGQITTLDPNRANTFRGNTNLVDNTLVAPNQNPEGPATDNQEINAASIQHEIPNDQERVSDNQEHASNNQEWVSHNQEWSPDIAERGPVVPESTLFRPGYSLFGGPGEFHYIPVERPNEPAENPDRQKSDSSSGYPCSSVDNGEESLRAQYTKVRAVRRRIEDLSITLEEMEKNLRDLRRLVENIDEHIERYQPRPTSEDSVLTYAQWIEFNDSHRQLTREMQTHISEFQDELRPLGESDESTRAD
ncbi:hypothetical protein AOQ84DRAFT_30223 [Glonium stellatum]|uniref:Uncharacterized protein n=1 Tax=Glonium stellatum TaxID=574774 RepID=A0A8E2JTH7_9PEZI|nr:hypothetical protein AOQ84DRAFT_30223 [Glonium stellatum]